jgi:hypothetical protein
MIKIDKGLPLPTRKYGSGRPPKYPWGEMDVGDSFYAPGVRRQSMSGLALRAQKSLPGKKWAVRTVEGGVRVWRVK